MANTEALQQWFLGGSRRWAVIFDQTRAQQQQQDTQRPHRQRMQAHVLRVLGLGRLLDEAAVSPMLTGGGRFLTAWLDLSGAAERLEETLERHGEEEAARCRNDLAKVVHRCACWDGEAALQLGCTTGLWIVDGEVWDRTETVDLRLVGTVPATSLRRCSEPVVAACHHLSGFVRLAVPRSFATGLRLTVILREGQSLADVDTVMGSGIRVQSAFSDGAERKQRWPAQPGEAALAPAGRAAQLQLRVSAEDGTPQRVLRALAAALGATVSAAEPTGDGGRSVVVQQLYKGAALLNGATVQREGWACHLQAAHPCGLRELSAALAAARAEAGAEAAAQRDAALRQLAQGVALHDKAAASVVQRLQTVHGEAASAGMQRATAVGQRALEHVEAALAAEDVLAEEPGAASSVAASALQTAMSGIQARERSLEKAEQPADAMDDETWRDKKAKEAANLVRQRELVA